MKPHSCWMRNMFPLLPWATAHSYQSLADESIPGAQGTTLSSNVAAHDTQVTQDTFEQSNTFSFMNHSDWYRYWVLSWNKLGIKDKSEARVRGSEFQHTPVSWSEIRPYRKESYSIQCESSWELLVMEMSSLCGTFLNPPGITPVKVRGNSLL